MRSMRPLSITLAVVLLGGPTLSLHTGQNAKPIPPAPVYFPAGAIWTQDISGAPVSPQSSTIIDWLAGAGGWGSGAIHIDFSIRVLEAKASTPWVPFKPSEHFYLPDSDLTKTFPLPTGGGAEGHAGYKCPTAQEDCHVIVVDRVRQKLYETWGATFDGNALQATILAIWDLKRIYPLSGRGLQCSSADAAGFPIAPLLFNADELARGHIDHAIRFILPNDRIRAGVFVPPATHAGGPKGPKNAPPYGIHLRLKASYNVFQLKPAAQVVARAMQKYGIYLADGGNEALTAQSDADTQIKYADVGFGSNDLRALKVTDFEVLDFMPPIRLTYDCERNP
ncbi:MAG TPA: hypothetical protein VMF56_06805 [Acidobacteriaceae bacterium]|nr:hypothetical protein [Acidobacteriaceae bacterium]